MKKKVCRECKIFVKEKVCPICKKDSFSESWQGRIHFVNASESFIAGQMGV